MSARIGGRTVAPALPVVDGSRAGPTEQNFDELLRAYSDNNIPLESDEGIRRRERALDRMGALCREWIRSVCLRLQLPPDAVNSAGGQLFTSGSYRLGVHEPGADIDTILVAPNMCTREDFFGSNYVPPGFDGDESELANVRDPDSLAERLRRHPDVTNFVPVEGAAVPILTFDWEGVNIDLLFARLNSSSVPPTLDIDNDAVLDGVDPATEKSLNGPRVTNLIAALASGTPERYRTFLAVVRCVRKWAKARGLYSNKMGYWGGVNINISVALVVQLYPNACAASLLRKFFLVFKSWRWPNPVMLTKPHDADLGLPVWSAFQAGAARQVAPIITPAYPAMNSTLAVSRQTLQIMHEEFCRGHEVVDRLWKEHQKRGGGTLEGGEFERASDAFGELFEPSDFFIAYPHYLSLCITGPTQADAQSWMGYVESRLRKLVSDMLGKSLPLSKIQLWPKKFEVCVADRTALLTAAQRRNCATYFIGFRVDRYRMRGDQLNVEQQMQKFRQFELSRFEPLVPGMDIYARSFGVKQLPLICFEMYEGGKLGAMKRRRRLRDADPRRQEAKRVARLAQLKARMAEMQRKKEEMATKDDETSRKRKRDGEEEDAEEADGNDAAGTSKEAVKMEAEDKTIGGGGQAEGEEEEEDLLEDALDAIQTDAVEGRRKTREEAEEDRKKLLAGELLEGAGAEGEGGEGEDDGADLADDADYLDVGGYTGEGARLGNILPNRPRSVPKSAAEAALTVADEEALILKRAGYTIVSDDEVAAVGGNVILPWRQPERVSGRAWASAAKNEDNGGSRGVRGSAGLEIRFRTQFDVVELDEDGYIIDKGDDDFKPSKDWTGRMPGFEFKLGERGLGYYRTGKKVVVPSNTAY